MKNESHVYRSISLFAGATIIAVMISACIAGSGEGKQDEGASEDVGQAQQAITTGGCNPLGFWFCSDPRGTVKDFPFVTAGPGCEPNEEEAEENCIAQCNVSCVLN